MRLVLFSPRKKRKENAFHKEKKSELGVQFAEAPLSFFVSSQAKQGKFIYRPLSRVLLFA
jgi:hypothetical protein